MLKQQEHVPKQYVDEIEFQFLAWKRELNEDVLDEFSLPPEACMYHFDSEEDVKVLLHYIHEIEYVEIEKVDNSTFFRIGPCKIIKCHSFLQQHIIHRQEVPERV